MRIILSEYSCRGSRFIGGEPLIHTVQHLCKDIFYGIMIVCQSSSDGFLSADCTSVTGKKDFRRIIQHFLQRLDPGTDVPVLTAADGVKIGPGFIIIVSAAQDLKFRYPDKNLVIRFSRCCDHLKFYSAADDSSAVFFHQVIGRSLYQIAGNVKVVGIMEVS